MKITRRIHRVLQANPTILQSAGVKEMFLSILSYDRPAAGRYLEVIANPCPNLAFRRREKREG